MHRWSLVLAAAVPAALVLGPVGGPAIALPARAGVRAPAVPATPGPAPAGAVFAVDRPPVATARAAPADGGRRGVDYRPPVDAPVGDAFRPPPTPYGAGNRGVDYATVEGQPVWAAAPGQVVFAGPVGGSLHVTILHPDGLRSSYSFLRSVAVRRGDAVEQGQVVGTARGSGLHVGARAGDAYLDPLVLFGPGSGRARLVADPDDSVPLGEAAERAGLVESLRHAARAMGGATREAVAWLEARVAAGVAQRAELARILASDAVSLSMPPALHLGVAALAWAAEQEGCTPAGTPAPAAGGRRLVVLVGGLGSSSDRAAAFTVDTAGLGYGPGDVHRFSYRAGGGPYAPADTQGDIGAAAALLAAQLDDLGRLHPGVPLDVVAHSQGGLVARAALLHHRPAGVATLVTLGTPHRGTDLATAAVGIAATGPGHALLRAAGALPVPIDPGATSVLQMAQRSSFLRDLPDAGWPPGVRVTSVAARSDPIVPSTRSWLAGAANVVVDPPGAGLLAHDRLPASEAATREIALARAGLGPTCRSLADRLADRAAARDAAVLADFLGGALAVAGLVAGPLRTGSGGPGGGPPARAG